MTISKAEHNDLEAILELQKLAYYSEAQLVNDFTIPPLLQTIKDTEADFNRGVMLKAVSPNSPDEIVGSVRGHVEGDTLHVGKLIVHPSHQNKGIGTKLLLHLESLYPGKRYELYTSEKSERNLYFYQKHGYKEFKRIPLNHEYEFVCLEKFG